MIPDAQTTAQAAGTDEGCVPSNTRLPSCASAKSCSEEQLPTADEVAEAERKAAGLVEAGDQAES